MTTRLIGAQGERLAEEMIGRRGYRVIARNYRNLFGEIDLVAMDRGTVCFIEVKTRTSPHCGGGAEAVTPAKRRRLTRAAWGFLKERWGRVDVPARFDVVAIDYDTDGQP